MIFVTGGAGFIGSNFVFKLLRDKATPIVNIDALTYATSPDTLEQQKASSSTDYIFVRGDIGDSQLIFGQLQKWEPTAIVHFAAETHVDRSIENPEIFVQSNVVGTFQLLEATRRYFQGLSTQQKAGFRFIHISTDEVYGSLAAAAVPTDEEARYKPTSPYAASKAASDHIARSYFHTYGLPVIVTNCSNNYGPYQFPEKLIPLCIHNALAGEILPIYGDGQQIRDWLYVEDHCNALKRVLEAGSPGETYNVGGWNEKTNLEVVNTLCAILDEEQPRADGKSYAEQITFVKDRPGHDRRYAIDASKIERELGWRPQETFETGIRKTVRWYLDNQDWVANVTSGAYRQWVDTHYTGN